MIVERIVPEQWSDCAAHQAVAASDLNMLVALSGRERSEAEFRALLEAAALQLERIAPAGGDFRVIEAVPPRR